MKKQILILLLCLISSLSYSQRVMTAEEKESLVNDPVFALQCKWAIKDYADFWSNNDGSAAANLEARITWAKNRLLSVSVLLSGITYQPENVTRIFLEAAKGKQFDLGAAPVSTSVLIQEWLDTSSFEEFTAIYFKNWGDQVNMSVGN
jgi:hypothetical protein